MRHAFIEAEKVSYPVALICRCLRLSRSGYYAWRRSSQKPASLSRFAAKGGCTASARSESMHLWEPSSACRAAGHW